MSAESSFLLLDRPSCSQRDRSGSKGYGRVSVDSPWTVGGEEHAHDPNVLALEASNPGDKTTSPAWSLDPPGSGADTDGDGILHGFDNCPDDVNSGQEDAVLDQVGDVCDPLPDDGDNAEAQLTPNQKGGVKERLYLLTRGGLIGVRWRCFRLRDAPARTSDRQKTDPRAAEGNRAL